MERDLGARHLFPEYGGRSGPKGVWAQAPGGQCWSRVRSSPGPVRGGEASALGGQLLGHTAELSWGWTRWCLKLLLFLNEFCGVYLILFISCFFCFLGQILEALLQVLHVLLGMCQALEIQEKGMVIYPRIFFLKVLWLFFPLPSFLVFFSALHYLCTWWLKTCLY